MVQRGDRGSAFDLLPGKIAIRHRAHLRIDSRTVTASRLRPAGQIPRQRQRQCVVTARERSPRSIYLRERMREIAPSHKHPEEAARHCLALASLYIERDNFDAAHDRLLEAKQLDSRISISSGLEAIRRARHPELKRQ